MGMFANAQKIEAPKSAAKKPKAPQHMIKGLEELAAIDAAMKALKGLAESYATEVKAQMTDYFVEKGCAAKARPVNFEGIDGEAKGSCQLKSRSSASVLTADDIALLKDHNIPYAVETTTAEAFLINPIYTNDMSVLAKVEAALADVDLPSDFLMKQEAVTRTIATEESLDAVFSHSREIAKELLPLVSTLAVKSSIPDNKFWAKLDQIMNPVDEEATEVA